jgi:hypothetical protein
MHTFKSAPPAADETEDTRLELLAEAVADVGARARRYMQEPAEGAWHDLVAALARTYGDSQAYDLLRAVEIHSRTSIQR